MSRVEATDATVTAARPPVVVTRRADRLRFLAADHARLDCWFELDATPAADRFEVPFVATLRRQRFDTIVRLVAVAVDGESQPAADRHRTENVADQQVLTGWAVLPPAGGRHTVRFTADLLDVFPTADTRDAFNVAIRHPTHQLDATIDGGPAGDVELRDDPDHPGRSVGWAKLTGFAGDPPASLPDPVRTADGQVRWHAHHLSPGHRYTVWFAVVPTPARPADPLGPDQQVQFDAYTRYFDDKEAGRLDDVIGQYVAYTDIGRLLADPRADGLRERAAAAAGLPPARVIVQYVG